MKLSKQVILSKLYNGFPFLWKCRLSFEAYRKSKDFALGFHLDDLRKYYSDENIINNCHVKGVIVMFDGRYPHGGLADRLKGLLSVYSFCEKYNTPFFINWIFPFNLLDYIRPNQVNWAINEKQICYNSKLSLLCVVDSTGNIICEDYLHKKTIKKLIRSNFHQKHIYTNAFIDVKNSARLFRKLFKPSELLRKQLEIIQNDINGKYITFSFRFLSLLGDFEDTVKIKSISEEKRIQIMSLCKNELSKQLSKTAPDYRILLFSDSRRFLDYIKDMDSRIYIIPGDITHMDQRYGCAESHLKTFIDFFTIMNACSVHLIRTKEMYYSGFPKLAAILGEKPFKDHLI